VARKKSGPKIYTYECSITEEVYKVTRQAPNPEDLISVKAYYDLHPENDDRPEVIKQQLKGE